MVIGPLGNINVLGMEEEIFSFTLDREKLEENRLKFPFLAGRRYFFHSTLKYETGISRGRNIYRVPFSGRPYFADRK
jgi:hypothetical protein